MCAICSTVINVYGYFGGSLIKNKLHLVFIFFLVFIFEDGKSGKNVSQRIVKRNVF